MGNMNADPTPASPVEIPVSAQGSLPNRERDRAIDILRGLALLVALIDHIEFDRHNLVLSRWTPVSLGFSDAAEAFVFLSGYVSGRSYSRRLMHEGLLRSLVKAIYRACQIYLCYLGAAAMVSVIAAAAPTHTYSAESDGTAWHRALTLNYQTSGFTILTFYTVMIPAAPVVVRAIQKYPWHTLLAAFSTYAASQMGRERYLASLLGCDNWFFNPFSWQLLFVVGSYFGMGVRTGVSYRRHWGLVVISGLIVVAGIVVVRMPLSVAPGNMPQHVLTISAWVNAHARKSQLGLVRLVHFAAVAYLVWSLVVPRLRACKGQWVEPLVVCGQYSLCTYTCGLVIARIVHVLSGSAGANEDISTLMFDLDACVLSICCCWIYKAWCRRHGGQGTHVPQTESVSRGSAN